MPLCLWWLKGESFLSLTRREPAEVLVVESWIGREGLAAAKQEFDRGGYRYLVTAGGLSKNNWDHRQWSYSEVAKSELERLGLPSAAVIAAPARDTDQRRTFASAVAVDRALHEKSIHPTAVNVFTLGAHARRSRLVFSKALAAKPRVGCIAWVPSAEGSGPWWTSSERSEAVIKETVGWLFELLLNSGRLSNRPADERAPAQ